MSDPSFEEKMRTEWNARAQKSFMQYTSGTQTEKEEDYVKSAERDAATILRYLGDAPTKTWKALDVGCGVGRIIQVLAPRFGEVHGVDVSDEMLKLARERLSAQPHVQFHRIEGTHLKDFADGTFQVMWSYSVFYHMPRTLYYGYLKELSRVMAPGGQLVYQLAQTYTLRRWLSAVFRVEPDSKDTNVRRFYTQGHLRALAAEHGFEVLAIEPGPGHDLWCHWRKK
ncbi:MAG TPA: methyltransferase domain-containing protein [Planctomycetota bacterium]|nr:methyltransferase domain-containing protein [Planctomycetota bacterium]